MLHLPGESLKLCRIENKKYNFEQGQKNQSGEMRNGYHQAENVHILCAQVNYATSEELVEG